MHGTSTEPAPRVVFLSVSGEMGGAERLLLDLIAGLRARDPRQYVAAVVASAGPLSAQLRALGVDVHELAIPTAVAALGDSPARSRGALVMLARLAMATPQAAWFAWRLRRLLARLGVHIVHSNGFKMHVLGALARPTGARLVWHLHDFITSRPVMSAALRALRARCDAAVAISEAVRVDALQVLEDRVPVTTIYDAIDLARFGPGPAADLDALAGMSSAGTPTVRIGLVATMAWWKGHDLFLRALARLPRELAWRAYVVGGPVYRTVGSESRVESLRAVASALGIADRVGFTGFVADTPGVMRALDVVVHASTAPEPFGLVIAEGMAAGRAVIASAGGAPPELVKDGEDGLLFPCGDEAALAARLSLVITDTALRARLGAAARTSAHRRFARERLAKDVAEFHARLASLPRRRVAGMSGHAAESAARQPPQAQSAAAESADGM